MSATSVVERIQRLEDIEAITNLMARYAFHINKGWDGNVVDLAAMRSIFAEDITYESEFAELNAVGIEQGLKVLKESTEQIEFAMHSFTNPLITIDEDTATGNWLMWVGSKRKGFPPNEVFMSVDITYVRTPQGWRIKTFKLHFGMLLHA